MHSRARTRTDNEEAGRDDSEIHYQRGHDGETGAESDCADEIHFHEGQSCQRSTQDTVDAN